MPQLPSGRRVAIDTQPLQDLLMNWNQKVAHGQLAGLRTAVDLIPYVRILNLVPKDPQSTQAVHTVSGSLPLPLDLEPRDSGLRLSDWPGAFAIWTDADKAAFQALIDARFMPYLEAQLDQARTSFTSFNRSLMLDLQDAWNKAGVQPNRRPAPDELPSSADIDEYHVVAALGQYCAPLDAPEPPRPAWRNAIDRSKGYWIRAIRRLGLHDDPVDPTGPSSEPAALTRPDENAAYPQDLAPRAPVLF